MSIYKVIYRDTEAFPEKHPWISGVLGISMFATVLGSYYKNDFIIVYGILNSAILFLSTVLWPKWHRYRIMKKRYECKIDPEWVPVIQYDDYQIALDITENGKYMTFVIDRERMSFFKFENEDDRVLYDLARYGS